MMRLGSRLFPGKTTLEKPRLFLYRSLCFLIVAMGIKKSSLAGESSWPWTGSGTEDTPTSKFLSPPGGKSHRGLTPRLEVCSSGCTLKTHCTPFLRSTPHSCNQLSAYRLFDGVCLPRWSLLLMLLLLSCFSRVWICATPQTAAHQAPPSLGFSRQEYWSGLPFPSPMHESENWKWSCSVMSDSSRPHGLQPTRLLHPWVFPGKSTGMGCHCLLHAEL